MKDKVITQLLKRISDLEFEVERLENENEEFYKLMEMQNKREYRSKFLKDFQKEYGKNVFPDYDEIYKRYDNYKSRIDKAIEYIMTELISEWDIKNYGCVSGSDLPAEAITPILEILKGVDKE